MHLLRILSLAAVVSALAFAQHPGKGVITGTVFDASTGQPVRGAQIQIDGQSASNLVTDLDGRYRLELAPGSYKLRFSAASYNETTIDEVVVQDGATVEASTVMSNKSSVTKVEVSEKVGAVAATAEAALTERRLAPVVSDSLSNEDLKASTASDAAGALEKVTGVSIVDNGYVFVRGLGERYSATMLNNAMIPTTEPERRVVPLDLFPASLIDNIKVLKTYSPDLPGEFSGGLVQMHTVEFPTQKTLNVTINYGFNTQTTFDGFNSYRGGDRDWTGFGGGGSGLPAGIPTDQRLFVGNFTEQQFQQFGQSFPANYETSPVQSMRPQQTYSVSGGNTFGRLGIVGALTFTNSPQRYPEMRRFLVNSGGGQAQIFSDYPTFDSDMESVRLGGVLNASLLITPGNKLVFRNTLTRDTDKESRVLQGLNGSQGNIIRDTRLRWVERSLFSTGLEGEHSVASFHNSLFTWQFTYSDSARNEPDMREVIYGLNPDTNTYRFLNLPESGLRFFSDLKDRIYEPQAAWGLPFYGGGVSGMFKVGFRGTVRRRDFQSRRFRYFPVRAQTLNFNLPPDELLGPANVRPDGFVVREITRGTDSYDASMDIYGGFAMVDLSLSPKWRLIAGARFEDADIQVTTIDPLVPGGVPSYANLANRDALPSVNVIYAFTPRQNWRFGYGRTVNRPDFRELSPFEFTNVVGGYSTVGNPELQRATIDNFDARWEYFPGGNQVIAASFFYKRFQDPIEQIYRPTASELRQSFLNVAGANNYGLEVEFRRGLGSLSRKLAPFAVQSNFTFVDSNVDIPVDRFPQLTSKSRPLVGQSRYLFNAIAEWTRPSWRSTARFYVNTVSRRVTDVGTFNLPDVYQERNMFLDLVYTFNVVESGKWNFRFSAENLGDNEYRFRQSDILVRAFRIGRTFTLGTTYRLF